MTNSSTASVYPRCQAFIPFFKPLPFPLSLPVFLAGALGEPGGGERGAGPADPPPGPGEPRPPADEDVSEPGGGDVQVRCTISGGFKG